MANFNAAVLTNKGISLLAKAQTGQTDIKLIKAVSGCGSYAADESLVDKGALKDQRQEFPLDKMSVLNDTTVSVRFTITNEQTTGNLQEGYHVKEVGIYAEDPDEGEILYAIGTAVEGQWDFMPAYNNLMPTYITVEFYAEVSNAAHVTIVCNGRFITAEEVEAELEKLWKAMPEIPDGILTETDKGVKNGVASLDSGGHIPYGQLPDGSGAIYIGEKLSFKHFTWRAVDNSTGWVGTYESPLIFDEDVLKLFCGSWLELVIVPDLDRLYSTWGEKDADHYACSFSGYSFRAFINKERVIKVFADSDLGGSDIKEVSFWPYIMKRQVPGY